MKSRVAAVSVALHPPIRHMIYTNARYVVHIVNSCVCLGELQKLPTPQYGSRLYMHVQHAEDTLDCDNRYIACVGKRVSSLIGRRFVLNFVPVSIRTRISDLSVQPILAALQ